MPTAAAASSRNRAGTISHASGDGREGMIVPRCNCGEVVLAQSLASTGRIPMPVLDRDCDQAPATGDLR
jgi:hypothetical protein